MVKKVKGVEFGKKAKSVEFSATGQGQIDVWLDNPDGGLIASTYINGNTRTSFLSHSKGTHDLVFIMSGEMLKVDSWRMKK